MNTVAAATYVVPPPASPPAPAPQPQGGEMLYAALQHGGYRLKSPIKLHLAEEGGAVSVTWEEAKIRVTGGTLGDALGSLRAAIIADAANLGRFLRVVG